MTIKAKFQSRCGRCGGAVAVGESVEWVRGESGVTHSKCPEVPTPAESGGGHGQSWTARKPGQCTACKAPVVPGQDVRYRYMDGARALEHVDCTATPPVVTGPTRVRATRTNGNGSRRNQRPGHCHGCGNVVPARAGELFYCDGDANGCMEHFDGGWAVLCGPCGSR